jgi:hypothetical protein
MQGTHIEKVGAGLESRIAIEHGTLTTFIECHLTLRWSGRVGDKVPSSNVGARAAQLNR